MRDAGTIANASPTRPCVLLITRNLPPLVGGMERLLHNAARGIGDYAQLHVIGPVGCRQFLPAAVQVDEVPPGLAPFILLSTWHAIRACRRRGFATVIGGSGLVAPILSLLSRLFGVRTAVFVHGLDIVVDNAAYRRLFVPCLRRLDLLIANSRNTRELALASGVPAQRITVINPGTDLPETPDADRVSRFREQHGLHYDVVVLFVGRMTRRKGLSGFIRHCLGPIRERLPGAGLAVVGDDPVHSLNRLGEQEAVLQAVADTGAGAAVTFLGQLDDDDLATCYAAADVQILPLVHVPGDVEGFGMVAIEAASCGTPTVAFDLGGVGDAISRDNGILVTADDYAGFADAVVTVLTTGTPSADRCVAHSRQFGWQVFHGKVRDALSGLHSRQGCESE